MKAWWVAAALAVVAAPGVMAAAMAADSGVASGPIGAPPAGQTEAAAAEAPAAPASPPGPVLALASGEVGGLYFPEAGAICRVVNRDPARRGLRCLVLPTAGSAANLAALKSGEADLAIVQSRQLAQAVAAPEKDGEKDGARGGGQLRSLMSLHGESLAILLGPSAKIKTPAELKGKRVALGRPGTATRQFGEALLAAAGVKPAELAGMPEIEPAKLADAVCRNEVEAAVVVGLAPIPEVQDAIDSCSATLLPLKGAAVDKLLAANPAYARQTPAEESYSGLSGKVPGLALHAVLVTTRQLPADKAYEVVKAVFDNLPALKGMHPLLGGLERKPMARDGLVAPLHDGAARFYKEAGLQ